MNICETKKKEMRPIDFIHGHIYKLTTNQAGIPITNYYIRSSRNKELINLKSGHTRDIHSYDKYIDVTDKVCLQINEDET